MGCCFIAFSFKMARRTIFGFESFLRRYEVFLEDRPEAIAVSGGVYVPENSASCEFALL